MSNIIHCILITDLVCFCMFVIALAIATYMLIVFYKLFYISHNTLIYLLQQSLIKEDENLDSLIPEKYRHLRWFLTPFEALAYLQIAKKKETELPFQLKRTYTVLSNIDETPQREHCHYNEARIPNQWYHQQFIIKSDTKT